MTFTIPTPDWVDDTLLAEDPHMGFSMYTPEGNAAVASTLDAIFADAIRNDLNRATVIIAVQQGVATLTRGYPEVHDTEPEWAITDAVNAYFDTQGWVHITRDEACP